MELELTVRWIKFSSHMMLVLQLFVLSVQRHETNGFAQVPVYGF